MTSYKPLNLVASQVLSTQNSINQMLERVEQMESDIGERRREVLSKHPVSANGLLKDTLLIKFAKNAN